MKIRWLGLAVGLLVSLVCAACSDRASSTRHTNLDRSVHLEDRLVPGRAHAAISPDGRAIVVSGPRSDSDRDVVTLFLVTDGERPRDLLPGDRAVRGTSTAKYLTGWVDPETFAYEEHVGTGARELILLDARSWEPIETIRLAATYFKWSPDSEYVAGQWVGGPPEFWVWDRTANEMLVLPPLPGDYQSIEGWSLDGRHLLFSAWTGAWPADELTTVEYYVLDIITEQVSAAGSHRTGD